MIVLYIVAAGLLCVAASTVCWALAKRYGLPRGGFWPFLALACVLAMGTTLLPAQSATAAPPSYEDRVRRSVTEITEENLRLADEIRRELEALKWRAKRN